MFEKCITDFTMPHFFIYKICRTSKMEYLCRLILYFRKLSSMVRLLCHNWQVLLLILESGTGSHKRVGRMLPLFPKFEVPPPEPIQVFGKAGIASTYVLKHNYYWDPGSATSYVIFNSLFSRIFPTFSNFTWWNLIPRPYFFLGLLLICGNPRLI